MEKRAQFVFELFVVEDRGFDFKVLLFIAERFDGFELRMDDHWPACGLVDDGIVLLREAVVVQVLVRQFCHFGSVD